MTQFFTIITGMRERGIPEKPIIMNDTGIITKF